MKILNKKGKMSVTGVILLLLFIGSLVATSVGVTVWYINKEQKIPPIPPIPPTLQDALTMTHNGETDRNVLIDIYVRDLYDPNFAVVPGITIYIYTYGTSPQQLAANGLNPEEADLRDSFATDALGKGRSTRPFQGGTYLTAVVGLDSATNKSQLYDFIVQGLTSANVPTAINCGIAFYKVMTEEAEAAWTWTDKIGTTITTWNYTSDSDGILEAKIKLVMSTSGECLRKIWSRVYGELKLIISVKVTHVNSTSSAAIGIDSYYEDWGTPSNQLVFAFSLSEIIYEVDSTGAIEGEHESYRYFTVKLDFTGCGFPATHAAATEHRFTIGGWCLIEQTLDQVVNAGLPSGDSANWFQDALGPLTITT